MEVMALDHCAFLNRGERIASVTSSPDGRLRRTERYDAPSFAFCSRGGEHSFRPLGLEWRTRNLEWKTLRLQHHVSVPARQRVNCLSQRTITAIDPVIGDKQELLVEAEQQALLKETADAIRYDLKGSCIFLVGMMGSGKSTVGKYLAEALAYQFFDSDKLVEQAAGGLTVAQMFRTGMEEEFRNAETEVLMQLSSMGRLVVATGGGAVVRTQNWGYMRHGITIWLDVPLEALASRVVAVGCESRPLLGQISLESAYQQALNCLVRLYKEREDYYNSADAVVSVAALAAEMGLDDIHDVTPAMLAVQVLREIATLIANKQGRRKRRT